jgi:methylated-DNA-[protein]-cysteine S-methyltransferase
MASIPYGRTKTYGDIARELGNRSLARAVGRICASNPLPVVIPCHRVIAQRALGGYSGGLDKKRFLLGLEGLAT